MTDNATQFNLYQKQTNLNHKIDKPVNASRLLYQS